MKKIAFYFAAIAAMSLAACSSSANTENTTTDTTEAPATEVVAATPEGDVVDLENDDQFRPGKNVDVFTVLDFNATWCVPCKKLTPAFEAAAKAFAGKVQFYSVDIDKNKATKEAFEVTSVPTVAFITPDGKVEKFVGLDPFTQGKTNENTTAEETTQIILDNLTEMIQKNIQ